MLTTTTNHQLRQQASAVFSQAVAVVRRNPNLDLTALALLVDRVSLHPVHDANVVANRLRQAAGVATR